MATIGNGMLTLHDHAKRMDPDGKIAGIIEQMSQTNEVIQDMAFVEGNLRTGHKTTVRKGLPSTAWRKINAGVPIGKSQVASVVDTVGQLAAENEVDIDIADLADNRNEFRLSEATAFMQAMGQEFAETLIYGDTDIHPERFLGLAPRYNSLSAGNGGNIIDAGGTGSDNTSIWLVVWGPNTCHGIFAKGLPAGLQHEDMGKQRVFDASGNPYYAYVDSFKWNCGLSVRDWRYVVRIANIDVSLLVAEDAAAAKLNKLAIKAINKLPTTGGQSAFQTSDGKGVSGSMGRAAFYCNRTVREALELQAIDHPNVNLGIKDVYGEPTMVSRGIPWRTMDAIVNAEARVV